jgi:hypothetical protein
MCVTRLAWENEHCLGLKDGRDFLAFRPNLWEISAGSALVWYHIAVYNRAIHRL